MFNECDLCDLRNSKIIKIIIIKKSKKVFWSPPNIQHGDFDI